MGARESLRLTAFVSYVDYRDKLVLLAQGSRRLSNDTQRLAEQDFKRYGEHSFRQSFNLKGDCFQ